MALCGSSMRGPESHWKGIKNTPNELKLSAGIKWHWDLSTGIVGSICDCAAEFVIAPSSFFSLSFFVSLFWFGSNCEQPVVRGRLEQTEARGQWCVVSASTVRQIQGERGHPELQL